MERADSKRTFCHSSVRAAWSAVIGARWTDMSMGMPEFMRALQEPGNKGAGPAAKVEGAGEPVTDAQLHGG